MARGLVFRGGCAGVRLGKHGSRLVVEQTQPLIFYKIPGPLPPLQSLGGSESLVAIGFATIIQGRVCRAFATPPSIAQS